MNGVQFGILAYVVVQFAIGLWVARRVKTTTDFLVAGRTLGLGLVSFSVFATFLGAEAIVGTSGAVYEEGLAGGRIDPFGYALAIFIVGAIFAVPLWKRGIITFADFFRDRYSPGVEKLVVIVLLPGSMLWAAAQVRAFGQVVSATSGLDVSMAIAVASVLVVAYSALGGLLADAWTDLIQGLAIIVGLVVLAAVVAGQAGGVAEGLASVESERLQVLAIGDEGLLVLLESFAIPICGTVVAIEIISRVLGARTAAVAARGAILGGAIYLVVGAIPVFLGLIGPQLLPHVEEAEQIVPLLAEAHLPGLLYVVFAGAVISAILSTVDSVLLATSGHVSRNIVERMLPRLEDRGRLTLNRVILACLAVAAFAMAHSADRVKDLVESASAAGSAGVFVVAVFGLFTRYGGALAAFATVLAGALSWLVLGALELETPYVAALALALLTYVAAAAVEKRTPALQRPLAG
ncbi:MAG: sodium:solute symporter family protein [Hyphomicrobiaceae bacterium]|nr:sodium:solute symporter family protein [Hyphomicrobiaceae bacterium]